MASLPGTAQDDILVGTTANDLITGLGGGDLLRGEGGSDTIFGGAGHDVIVLSGISLETSTWGSMVYGGDGNDLIVSSQLSAWGAYMSAGLGVNRIIGSLEAWEAGDGDDLIYGDMDVGGMTVVQGALGSGTAVSGDGRVQDSFLYIQWFLLTDDADHITFSNEAKWKGCAPGAGSDTIIGGTGLDDVFYGAELSTGITLDLLGGTLLDPWGATDHLSGVESIRATQTADSLDATDVAFAVTFEGNGGADTLRGGLGADTIRGGEGVDRIFGSDGDDVLEGGAGNDIIDDGRGNDTINGGDGIDTFVRTYTGTNLFNIVLAYDLVKGFNYQPSVPDVAGDKYIGVENLTLSGEFTFLVLGDQKANRFQTDRGNDTLSGAGGADTLIGGGGADRLTGGGGADRLTGGAGSDRFLFVSLGDVDTITDFTSGADRIGLDAAALTGLGLTGPLSGQAFRQGNGATAAADASDRIIYDTATGGLYHDPDGIGGAGSVRFAQLGTIANHPVSLTAADFFIF